LNNAKKFLGKIALIKIFIINKIKIMRKIVRITESDINKIANRVLNEFVFDDDDTNFERPNKYERRKVSLFKKEIMNKLESGGTDWATNVPNPPLKSLIDGIRRVCDKYENI